MPPTRWCAKRSRPKPAGAGGDAAGAGLLGRLFSNRDVAILIVAVVLFALFALLGRAS